MEAIDYAREAQEKIFKDIIGQPGEIGFTFNPDEAIADITAAIEKATAEKDAEIERLLSELKECPLLHTACCVCGIAIAGDGTCGCGDNKHPVGRIQRDLRSQMSQELATLRAALEEMYAAMVAYQWDSEGDAPPKHRDMMDRAAAALATKGTT